MMKGCMHFGTERCGERCPVGRKAVIVNGVDTGRRLEESCCPMIRAYEANLKEAENAD